MKYFGMPLGMWMLCGTAEFVREDTLASGGPYCDCGYHKLNRRGKMS